jgi:hypothetical protein
MGIRIALAAGLGCAALAAGGLADAATRTFHLGRVSFRHPAAWRVQRFASVLRPNPGGSRVIAYVSPQALHDPCHRIPGGGGACTLPIDVLPRGGVLAIWFTVGGPPLPRGPVPPGERVSIGGHPGRVRVMRPGACSGIRAQETLEAVVAAGASVRIGLTVCFRGPGIARTERMARAMLASLRIAPA